MTFEGEVNVKSCEWNGALPFVANRGLPAKSGDGFQSWRAVLFDAFAWKLRRICMQAFKNQLHQLLWVNRFKQDFKITPRLAGLRQ